MSASGLADQDSDMVVGPVCAATLVGGAGGAAVLGVVRKGV